ncbi:MAG TPA: endonuclease III domain-containing protein [Gammaproteobacteria bacterium]|nr:endonuclease III domain-containing protein [Gammaproteobacteria bacterium]
MSLQQVFDRLLAAYGPQGWWPGDTPFEVMVGAILTQNTAWGNVEKAIANLKQHQALDAEVIADTPQAQLAAWLKPSGYFNIKATRLRNFCRWYLARGGFEALSQWPSDELRHGLLSVNGVGPETADDMLLYAFERPVFVIDAYTRRLFSRLGLLDAELGYETLRRHVEAALPADAALFNEFHALIVRHAKERCRKRPLCEDCPLVAECRVTA